MKFIQIFLFRICCELPELPFQNGFNKLKLFFMSDKRFKTIQQAQEILKSIPKDNHDKQIVDEKIKHTMQKLEKLKVEIKKNQQVTKRQAKANMKQLNKQKEKLRYLDMKLQQSGRKPKNSDGQHKKKEHQISTSIDESQYHNTDYKYLYERQKRKKRQGQQKLKQYKDQNQKLQEKLAQKQRQIQNIRQQLQVQKLLVQQFMNQQSEDSFQNQKNEDQQQQQQNILKLQLQESKSQSKMMDLSEGRPLPPAQVQQQPRKLSQQQQTDDQFQQQEQPLPEVNFGPKISQIETFQQQQTPQLKNLNSIETQVSSLNKSTEYTQIIEVKPEIQTASSTGYQSQNETLKLKQQGKITEEVQKEKQQQPQSKISSLFSWIGWWKKSQKK